jgi:hypothetical protein
MAFKNLEETAMQAPVSESIIASGKMEEVISACRQECRNVEALCLPEQLNVLMKAERNLNKPANAGRIVENLANSVVFQFHIHQFGCYLPELRRYSRTADGRYFDTCYYAGTHNYFAMKKFGSATGDGFSRQALTNLDDALAAWPNVVEYNADWHYRHIRRAWSCLRAHLIEPSRPCLMQEIVNSLNIAANEKAMNAKDHRHLSMCISAALNLADSPKNTHLAGFRKALSNLAYKARDAELAGR